MCDITALSCVAQNDICSLRIICTTAHDKTEELERTDYYGNTALLKACYLGYTEAALTLLHFGANIKAVNHYGQNALTLATYCGNYQLIYELLRYCPYKEFNKTTLTPALCVAMLRNNWSLVNFFKELDRHQSFYIQTAHGLNYEDIMGFLRLGNPSQQQPPPPQPQSQQKYMHI